MRRNGTDVSGKIDMVDIAIVLIVAVLIVLAARGSVKHFKGEGPCCGGGSAAKSGEKVLNGPVMKRRTLKIEGMHCQNCAERVRRAINSVDGAAAEFVDHKSGIADVKFDRNTDDFLVRKAIENAGYKVISVS